MIPTSIPDSRSSLVADSLTATSTSRPSSGMNWAAAPSTIHTTGRFIAVISRTRQTSVAAPTASDAITSGSCAPGGNSPASDATRRAMIPTWAMIAQMNTL